MKTRNPDPWYAKLLAPQGQTERARAVRRAYGIHFYAGRNGSGKSLCAVYDTLPDLEQGKSVLSTVRILDYQNPRPCDDLLCEDPMHGHPSHMAAHPLYVPFTRWPQLLEWHDGPVIMDEITGVADSNESAGLPPAVGNKLAQLRRAEVTLRITGLAYMRANKRIREACTAMTLCTSTFAVRAYAEDGSEKVWKERRLSKWKTYDAKSIPVEKDATKTGLENADVLTVGTHWIPTSPAIRAYDTLAPVLVVGDVSDAGRCAHCGGTRRAEECSCDDYQERRSSRRSARAQGREAPGTDAPARRRTLEAAQ